MKSSLIIFYISARYFGLQVLLAVLFPTPKQNHFDFLHLLGELRYLLVKDILHELMRQLGADFLFELPVLQDEEKQQPNQQQLGEDYLEVPPLGHLPPEDRTLIAQRCIQKLH